MLAVAAVPVAPLVRDRPHEILAPEDGRKSGLAESSRRDSGSRWLTVVAGSLGEGGLRTGDFRRRSAPVVYHDSSRGDVALDAGQEQTVLLYAKSGPINTPIEVRLIDTNGNVRIGRGGCHPPRRLASTQELVVGLGPSIGLADAVATIRHARRCGDQHGRLCLAKEELPDRWWGYDGVDELVLATSDWEFIQSLTDEQRQAIVEWVQLGGRLLLSAGSRGEEIAKPESGLSSLIPGELVDVTPLRERTGLETFTKAELPFDDPVFQRNRPYVTRLKNTRGESCSRKSVPRRAGRSSFMRPWAWGKSRSRRSTWIMSRSKIGRVGRGWWRHCSRSAEPSTSSPIGRRRMDLAPGLRRSCRPASSGARSVSGRFAGKFHDGFGPRRSRIWCLSARLIICCCRGSRCRGI